eukprot:SAG11_NODE_2696_length_3080_cov_2.220731_2_plen_277_part_00
MIEAAQEANVRLVLLSACYERGGFDDAALGAGQRRFATPDLPRFWEQVDQASAALAPPSASAVQSAAGTNDWVVGGGVGVVIHSLRAVGLDSLKAISAEASRRGLMMHVHLEEQQKEIDDCLAVHGMTPMALLLNAVPAEQLPRTVAVHCTHSEQAELAEFVARGGQVCVCPLTEAALGDGVFRSLEASRGMVSLGTDCNARIDMFEEMRWLEYSQRLARGRRGALSAVVQDEGGDGSTDGALATQLLRCAVRRTTPVASCSFQAIDAFLPASHVA